MSAPVPVILLTGYLGAGKTTILNRLLTQPAYQGKNIALIINEFGSLGVDGRLVEAGEHAVYELNKGSLFCICIKTDFIKTLTTIAEETKPDMVIVEATGIAETRDLEDFFKIPYLHGTFTLQANICIVDALNFFKVLPFLVASRSQVARCDTLVINKCDLVTSKEQKRLSGVLADINAEAPQTFVTEGQIPESLLEGITHHFRTGDDVIAPPTDIKSFSLKSSSIFSRKLFMSLLERSTESILRLKGDIDFGKGAHFFELAGGKIYEDAQRQIFDGTTSISVIVKDMDPVALEAAFLSTAQSET